MFVKSLSASLPLVTFYADFNDNTRLLFARFHKNTVKNIWG